MKYLYFSDLHAHNYEQFSVRLPSGRNSRLEDCLEVARQAACIAVARGVEYVIFMGDAYHSRSKLDVDVLIALRDVFFSLSKVAKLIVLVGNHDQYTRVGEVYSVDVFADFATVVAEPTIMQLGPLSVAFYPHTSDVAGMQEWIRQMPPCDLFCFHQGLSEAAVGPYDMHVKTELSLNDLPFDKVKNCIAGDFHKRQFLRGGKFHYVGSPLQLSMGERDEEKCFSLIDSDKMDEDIFAIESIPTTAPRFYLFDDFAKCAEWYSEAHTKDFVRVIVDEEQYHNALQLKEKYPRLQIEVRQKDKPTSEAKVSMEAMGSDRVLLEEWVAKNPSSIDAQELIFAGMELLQEGYDE